MTRAGGAKQTQQQQPPPAVVASPTGSSQTSQPGAEFFDLQRDAGNRLVGEWLKVGLRNSVQPVIQTKPVDPGLTGPAEQQADKAAEEVTKKAEPRANTTSLIVEDDAQSLKTGQMKKSEFLGELRTATNAAAEEALAGTMWSSLGCPYIERWFNHYEGQSAEHVERAVQKFTPEARGASNARAYIPAVTNRLRRGIEQWKQTGEVPPDLPPEVATGEMPGMTAGALVGSLVSGALSAVGSAVSGLASGAAKAVSSVGSMLFKERDGGAEEVDDPQAIRSQLGSGRSLDGAAKSKMESAYGADFSGVRIHTDTKAQGLADSLNAKAFTVGTDIAFGTGEYQPDTVVGDALIAHELAHVVQQRGGSSGVAPQTKQSSGGSGLEHDADAAAAGAVISVWGGAQAMPRDLQTSTQPRRRSGLQLQRCGGSKKEVKQAGKAEKALTKEEAEHARFRSEKLANREKKLEAAGTSLREVGSWASAEQKKQQRPVLTGVVGLDPKQRTNAAQAVTDLQALGPTFDTKGLEAVRTKLQEAATNAKSAKQYIGREEREFQGQMRLNLNRAGDSLDEAVAALEKLNDSVDGYEIWQEIESARALLDQVKAGQKDPFDGIEEFTKKIKTIRDNIAAVQEKYKRYPDAIARITFVIQYFVAVNSPGFSGLPSAEDIKKFKGSLSGSLSSDFNLVFGGGGLHSPFELFIEYADILDKQLAVLDKMSTAKTPAKTPIPQQGEIEAFFKTLAKKSNAEVRGAYEDYAQAYFYHRIVANLDDMAVTNVADLFQRDLSITGTRPLVCSGYAILGADLLGQAGGTVVRFISAVRATDDDIRNNTIDAGHALAEVKRKGNTFFVSNYIIVDTEEEGIGPDAVAWAKKDAPLFKASGKTNAAALAALREVLRKRREQLERR